MPAQTLTSADKKREAAAARRRAAQRSAANRRTRQAAEERHGLPAAAAANEPATAAPSPPATETLQAEPAAEPMAAETTIEDSAATATEDEMDAICELAESNPQALGRDANSVRQLCRNRRQALATKGKAAIGGKPRNGRRNGAASGRALARQRRAEMCRNGRGDKAPARPSGRVRGNDAPPKVETGTTLAGQPVTGTQVERSVQVTGNESGSCRPITGTEYVGGEQFQTFCETSPEANPPKVGVSNTSRGMPVSGTEVGRSSRVTGDESGSCSKVTGDEYFGAERFDEFCDAKAINKSTEKVAVSKTERKGITVTGADEARPNMTTGNEAGASRSITGTQYADTEAAKLTINGPDKVALTHTIAGQSVTGTEVGRSARVTGDEQGSCRSVTGTEYLSNEQFQSVCQTLPEPTPAKVGIDSTRQGLQVTGNLVDRSEKVTGNEPGSCQRVTGSQYNQSSLCGGAPPKAHSMQTLAGNALTGNRVDHGPKLSGDEQGGCEPVTGTEYYGKEQFAEYCASTPNPTPEKVGVEHNPSGQAVSGTMLTGTNQVTGNEAGRMMPVSGTPYAGINVPQSHGACCNSCAAQQMAEAAGLVQPAAANPQTHLYPGQQDVPQAHPNTRPQASGALPVHHAMPTAEPAPQQDFSIIPPSRQAAERVTGSTYGETGRITGPINLAPSLVSGTPEFRYGQNEQATQIPAVTAPPSAQPQAAEMPPQRITGEGREHGTPITGDDWARSQQVTGTEGRWAHGRNPTLRGNPRSIESGAHINKTLDRPEVPAAQITGSSGNCDEGALITVSGGARG